MMIKCYDRVVNPEIFQTVGDCRTHLPWNVVHILYLLQNAGVIKDSDVLDFDPGHTDGATITLPVVKFDVGFPSQESNCQVVIDGQFLTFSDISQMEVRFDIHRLAHIKGGLDGTVTRFLETLKTLYGDYPTARCYYPHP